MTTPATLTTTTTTATTLPSTFPLPSRTSFPPFYTLQPNLETRTRQLTLWSSLIQSYCAHQRLAKLSLASALASPLFRNDALGRRLSLLDARAVLDWMCSAEGGGRAEWLREKPSSGASAGGAAGPALQKNTCYVYYHTPAEWADLLYGWVESTGQRGAVLTLYELVQGDAGRGMEWEGLDQDVLFKALGVLVKRGRAQVFGGEGSEGVKFF
ncbi:putative vacuolar protein-sorting-associated protein [Cryomyces antarcticus]|uniref:ESCRT-II complex subunit VPS25 n=1 Tax=Cryomyces antarcticus TaxID=329879 RepID=A0ABR0KRI7_9PEZI|nr:hypothetical protein LTR39_004351 [Cryomyces antarcticus]KAK5012157.1 hypothetical protein LTR60_004528 [Cryomyces antarcticus]KAK5117831.1 hypothetical protein LTR16_004970 [Cryomyces antarcticus]